MKKNNLGTGSGPPRLTLREFSLLLVATVLAVVVAYLTHVSVGSGGSWLATLASAAAAYAAFGTLVVALRKQDVAEWEMGRRAAIEDEARFTDAVERLQSDKQAVQWSGFYSLLLLDSSSPSDSSRVEIIKTVVEESALYKESDDARRIWAGEKGELPPAS